MVPLVLRGFGCAQQATKTTVTEGPSFSPRPTIDLGFDGQPKNGQTAHSG